MRVSAQLPAALAAVIGSDLPGLVTTVAQSGVLHIRATTRYPRTSLVQVILAGEDASDGIAFV